eukprot:2048603-Alexandrium_andersonii.AAC.1
MSRHRRCLQPARCSASRRAVASFATRGPNPGLPGPFQVSSAHWGPGRLPFPVGRVSSRAL